MAKPNRLPELAREREQTVTQMIADALMAKGSVQGAAQYIGVSPWTISRWLLKNNLEVRIHPQANLVSSEPEAHR